MKQARFLFIVLLTLILLCGCAHQKQAAPTTGTKPASETAGTAPTEPPKESPHPDVFDCASAEDFVTASSQNSNTPCRIYLKKYRNDQTDYISYDLYIEVDTGSQVLKKVLKSRTSTLPVDRLFFGDVDGDGIREILVHSNTGGVGGFGLWYTWVLKVEGNDIRILFENYNEYDTGFESRFLDGYQMEVKNKITGYTLVFDIKESHKAYIDAIQKLPDGNIIMDPFYVFEPEDVDNDGISEIICKQYTSWQSHADYTGTACSVLKFNNQKQVFEVVDAWYEPYTSE